MTSRAQTGITLIELVVSAALLGVLAAVGFGAMVQAIAAQDHAASSLDELRTIPARCCSARPRTRGERCTTDPLSRWFSGRSFGWHGNDTGVFHGVDTSTRRGAAPARI